MKSIVALACATLVAGAAQAGDQPVLPNIKTPVFEYIDFPIYFLNGSSSTGSVRGVTATADGSASAASTGSVSGGQGRVGAVTLSRAQSDALYAQVLAEARARKLR